MANPAELLHAQLTAWNHDNSKTTAVGRELAKDPQWRSHRTAVELLGAIETLLDEYATTGELDVSEWKKEFPNWCRAVFAYPNGWNTANSSIDPQSLRMLAMLGTMLRMTQPKITSEGVEQMNARLDEVRQTQRDRAEHVPHDLNRHLTYVIAHLQLCLDDFALRGEFDLQKALIELRSIIVLLTEADPEGETFWAKFKGWFGDVFVGGVAGAASKQIGIAAVNAALPPGMGS
ncbi:hypothetical protein ACFORJ_07985 [Corynebacterium hansenii]|uniref:Uncharacterized protein n=1 Tax=Corynebacterium hansenii TaxID=394964 RepID=A0ABV7ZPB0_9CORY|nr:hypothetical protein [Corynebacterium hansenii]